MQAYTVYYVDYAKGERTRIGKVVERRKKPRPDNLLGLLKLARQIFGYSAQSAFQIVLDKNALGGPESRT